MQRTVKTTKLYYATNTIDEQGELKATLNSIEINESNLQKAIKVASKKLGFNVQPLKVQVKETLYEIDDETFFKYAKPVNKESV